MFGLERRSNVGKIYIRPAKNITPINAVFNGYVAFIIIMAFAFGASFQIILI